MTMIYNDICLYLFGNLQPTIRTPETPAGEPAGIPETPETPETPAGIVPPNSRNCNGEYKRDY